MNPNAERRDACKVCGGKLPARKSRYCSRYCQRRAQGWRRSRRRNVAAFLASVAAVRWLTREEAEAADYLLRERGWRALRRPDGTLLAVGVPVRGRSSTERPSPDSQLAHEAAGRYDRLRAARAREREQLADDERRARELRRGTEAA